MQGAGKDSFPNEELDDDYDSPWKNIIQAAFPEFMAFYFPAAGAQIDWTREHEFLEQELRQVLPEAEVGLRIVDVLARVFLCDGSEKHIFIHVEVQSQRDPGFAERVFTAHARLYERYKRPVASFAVLADDSTTWRPSHFSMAILGCTHRLDFPIVKLIDYADRLIELPGDPNPFGVMTAAHLLTRRSRKNPGQRFAFKRHLLLLVIEHHSDRPRIVAILKALDWMMRLPKDMNLNLWQEINHMTRPRKEWLTPPEIWAREEAMREGMAEGLAKGLEQGLEQGLEKGEAAGAVIGERTILRKLLTLRFGALPDDVLARLDAADTTHLECWAERVLDAQSLAEIFRESV